MRYSGEPQKSEVKVNVTQISWLGLLAIVFIALKLTGYIAWSWWWVLAPIWIPWAILLGVLVIVGLVWGFLAILSGRK